MVYESDESGQYEIYVQAFPEPRGKWQISSGGGQYAQWAPDGKEIFYLSLAGKLMSVGIEAGSDSVKKSAPREVFGVPWDQGVSLSPPYAVAPDGKRFLARVAEDSSAKPLEVIVNWQALLKN